MANIDQNQVQVFPIMSQVQTTKGPLAVLLFMDFGAQNEYDLNLQSIQARDVFDFCQAMFIDNSAGGAAVTVNIGNPGTPVMTIVAKAGSQGWYNVVCPNPIQIQFTSAGGSPCKVLLVDVAIPGATWSAI